MDEIPIIDISGLNDPSPGVRAELAARLGSACREVGFFYVAGHGIAEDARRAVFAAAHAFFARPFAEKDALSIKRSPHNRGYAAEGSERLDANSAPDRKEAFNVGLELDADDPEVRAGKMFRGVNLWPRDPAWRETVLRYFDACLSLGNLIHRGFALDLGLPEFFFDDKLDRPCATLRLLHYPAREGGADAAPGAGEHTDYGNITILATDGVAGLQVRRRDGVWLDAPHVEGAFVCNIGDCLMRWSNDVYVSTPHRVTRPEQERYSLAFFLDANPDARVEAVPSCVPAGARPKYAPTTAGDYLRSRLDAAYILPAA